jgi:hypothetical protein
MRGLASSMGIALVLVGCSAVPVVAPPALVSAPARAQWVGQETPQLVRQLVLATFDRADNNHDRFLDASEWDRADVATADLDKDGRVTTLEWAQGHPIEPLVTAWQTAAQVYFGRLDADKDGRISRVEVRGLAAVPGFGVPKDLYFDRYAGLQAGLSPKVFVDFLLQTAFDNGRFKPFILPPAFPTAAPGSTPSGNGMPASPTVAAASQARR